MDQFVTTYRKDYVNQNVHNTSLKTKDDFFRQYYLSGNPKCSCHCAQRVQEELLNPENAVAKPGLQSTKFTHPGVFLKNLKEKFPDIFKCLAKAPQVDVIARVNRDRLRSTYEVDYCKVKEHVPGGDRKALCRKMTCTSRKRKCPYSYDNFLTP
ncbi:unnamed protein product [Brassicogethes aeneus]|uniref:Uncharacterized protein n=1 Tax=Brassicogethes aeneus TaxID=1431903 RepID=A0A9P0AR70_BRAAE|nr:unnamed protein product [Brassicogethes aeneus]